MKFCDRFSVVGDCGVAESHNFILRYPGLLFSLKRDSVRKLTFYQIYFVFFILATSREKSIIVSYLHHIRHVPRRALSNINFHSSCWFFLLHSTYTALLIHGTQDQGQESSQNNAQFWYQTLGCGWTRKGVPDIRSVNSEGGYPEGYFAATGMTPRKGSPKKTLSRDGTGKGSCATSHSSVQGPLV